MNANTELRGRVCADGPFGIDLHQSLDFGGYVEVASGSLRRENRNAEDEDDAEHHGSEFLKGFHG